MNNQTNDITGLQSILFETLRGLQDKDNPMDLDRATTIGEVSTVLINSARAEIDFAKVNGSVDSQFFHKPGHIPVGQLEQQSNNVHKLPDHSSKPGAVTVEGNVTTHKLIG